MEDAWGGRRKMKVVDRRGDGRRRKDGDLQERRTLERSGRRREEEEEKECRISQWSEG